MPLIMRESTVTYPPLSCGLLISVGSSALSEWPSSTLRIADLYNCLCYTIIVSFNPPKAVPAHSNHITVPLLSGTWTANIYKHNALE